MRYVDVLNQQADAFEGMAYPVDTSALSEANVAMVVFPDEGDPWVERIPFEGREQDAEIIAIAEGLLAEAESQHAEENKEPTPEELLEQWRQNASVSAFQAHAALTMAGYMEDIEALLADPSTDPLTVLAWDKAQTFRRLSPTVLEMAELLGLTAEQLDDLFRFAATIEA